MKTMLTLAAAALLTLGLSAQPCECEGNACQTKAAPAAQTCPKTDAPKAKPDRPAKQKRQHARKGADKDAQGPRGPKARPNRGIPEGKGPAEWKEMPPAQRAKVLRARAAELEKRAAELEAKATEAPAAE